MSNNAPKAPPVLPANPHKTRREEKPGSVPVKTK